MATKKSADTSTGPQGPEAEIEERRKRREEATTVDGSESANTPEGE